MDLRFVSHNLHGFNNSKSFLDVLCNNSDIVFVQEHWLLPSNINLFTNVNNAFAGFAVSGVRDIEQFSLTGGRP